MCAFRKHIPRMVLHLGALWRGMATGELLTLCFYDQNSFGCLYLYVSTNNERNAYQYDVEHPQSMFLPFHASTVACIVSKSVQQQYACGKLSDKQTPYPPNIRDKSSIFHIRVCVGTIRQCTTWATKLEWFIAQGGEAGENYNINFSSALTFTYRQLVLSNGTVNVAWIVSAQKLLRACVY